MIEALVDLPLHFLGLLVERIGWVAKDTLAGLLIEEVFVNSSFVEAGLLVRQGIHEVVSMGEVQLDSIFVVLVVLVFQSLLVVLFVRQVNLSLALVEDALGCFVIRTVFVSEGLLQVLGLAEVLQDGEAMILAILVNERIVVNFGVFECLGSKGLCAAHGPLVWGQMGDALRFRMSGLGRRWCLGS